MKVVIRNLKKPLAITRTDTFEATWVSMDSEKRYAVAEIYKNETYVALNIISVDDDILVGEYVDRFEYPEDDTPMLMDFTVSWNCIKYGFCKLIMWAPELVNRYGNFSHTAKRFYFDWELYKKSYEDIHGVPCIRKNPNGEQQQQ